LVFFLKPSLRVFRIFAEFVEEAPSLMTARLSGNGLAADKKMLHFL